MKFFLKATVFVLLMSLTLSFLSEPSYAQGEISWYVKRNGNKRPELDASQNMIYKYNGYFIDKKLSDNSNQKTIYLTFDLGYENGNTERILDTLRQENVPAAFFILDNIILKNSDLVTRMHNEGHLICNHTKKHKNLCFATEQEISNEILSLERLLSEKTGITMSKYFRFPEGKYSENALATVDKLGYKTVFWSFAYADWDNNKQPLPEKAIKKIIDNTHNGAVMLFHPTSKTNADIFPQLIREWKDMGYTFGTLDELVK